METVACGAQSIASNSMAAASIYTSCGRALLLRQYGLKYRFPALNPQPAHLGIIASLRGQLAVRFCAGAAQVTEAPVAQKLGAGTSETFFKSTAYPFTEIESKWQAYWDEHQTFRTPDFKDLDTSKPKFYALDMFPYPR